MKNQKPRGNLGISRAPSYWSKRALLVTDTWTPRTFGRYWLHPRAWKTDGTKGIHLPHRSVVLEGSACRFCSSQKPKNWRLSLARRENFNIQSFGAQTAQTYAVVGKTKIPDDLKRAASDWWCHPGRMECKSSQGFSDAMKMANGLRLTFFPAKKQVYGRFIRKTHPLESWIFQPRGSMGATDCVVAFDAHCAGSGKIRPSGQHVAISLATGEHSTCFVQLII